ncbi:MAG TPA: hypothetical protein VFT70_16345 [Nocardioides sp.]|nr:hypothetical protein [Nocardioides sp.]
MRRRLLAPAAPIVAAMLVAMVTVVLPAAPATAAGCPTDHGVTVVVDFHQLGGGVQTSCVAEGGGQAAAELFPAAGFPLTYVQRQPGFVCRVDDKPADDPCANTPPADAYWGLYWSDGRSGRWTYSTTGAGGQHVPDGGYAGFSWQGGGDGVPPGYSPAVHPSSGPSPTHAPTKAPTNAPTDAPTQAGPSAAPSSGAGGASESVAPTAPAAPTTSPSATKGDRGHTRNPRPSESSTPAAPSASPTSDESPAITAASSDPADPGGGGLPGWVAPGVILVLFGAAGAVAVVRRRQGAA